MIYQIEIGSNDNAYIITGGLTGLTEFNPTIILGDDTGVRINVDSKDDDIFTSWIKQSMEISVVKSSEGQYADILAGDDNDTWGVLIENGYLYLSEGLITISDDAVVKFKGTLALESYSEEYKQTSIVSFTFHDRIGTMEDDIFYTNTQFKNVADILACCLSNVICSDTLYLEWPYTLSSSDDPTEILIDVEEFHGKKKIEVLEDVLHDFGMQLIVDFWVKQVVTLKNAGAVVVRSVTDIVQQNVVYWNMSLSSFTSSVCGREYFTYTGDKLNSKLKTRYLLNTIEYPLINNDAVLGLERVGSAIKAKNEIELNSGAIFNGEYDRIKTVTNTSSPYDESIIQFRYCSLGYIDSEEEVYDVTDKILELMDDADLSEISSAFASATSNGEGLYLGPSYLDLPSPPAIPIVRLLFGRQIFVSNNQFVNNETFDFNVKYSAKTAYGGSGGKMHACIFVKINGQYYYHNGSSFDVFTDWYQLATNSLKLDVDNTLVTKEYVIQLTTYTDSDAVILPALISIGGTPYEMLVEEFQINAKLQENNYYPSSINLTTQLSGNNRKEISLESKILNAPNVLGSGFGVKYVIKDTLYDYPLTLDYKLLSQTLLAHLSDQYGWQYDGNRWNLDGSCKCFPLIESLNIAGQFGLDEKILIFLNGDYDAKRKILKGKWGQVLEVGDEPYRLEKDNFEHFTWDNGNYIMTN